MEKSDYTRIFDIPAYLHQRFPNKHVLTIVRDNQKFVLSSADLINKMDMLSAGLLEYGYKPGDRIGILSHHGSPEWNIIDLACQQVGIIVVPLHHNYDLADFKHILEEVGLSACFVSRVDWKERFDDADQHKTQVFTFRKMEHEPYWEELMIVPTKEQIYKIRKISNGIKANDLATIVYTSGTSGVPKGVMLSHHNIVCNIKSIIALVPINYKSVVASFLPLSHIFERMVIYTYLATGASIHYILDQRKLIEEVRKIRPHYITAVPRAVEKVYEGIKAEMDKQSLIRKKLISWALKKGKRFDPTKRKLGWDLRLYIGDIIVYRKWRRVLGGRIKGIVVGAAAMRTEIVNLFNAAKIPIREGYGLTETSPVISFNRFEPGGWIPGTVGIPIPGVQVRINKEIDTDSSIILEEGEGEIQVKGPNVMLGYYRNPEATKARFTDDGWFRTGDIGRIVHKRFLQITDRKKDIFKTHSGRYVAPARIESVLNKSEYISESMVFGMGKANVSALIIPDFEALRTWCEKQEIHWTAPLYMLVNPRVENFYASLVNKLNEQLKSYERVAKFLLLETGWTIETGEYTPTLKLRRHYIMEKFREKIEEMYK